MLYCTLPLASLAGHVVHGAALPLLLPLLLLPCTLPLAWWPGAWFKVRAAAVADAVYVTAGLVAGRVVSSMLCTLPLAWWPGARFKMRRCRCC
jgi:hypothetical protein